MRVKCLDCSRELTYRETREIRLAMECDWIELFELEGRHLVALLSEYDEGVVTEYMTTSWSESGRLALDDMMLCSPEGAGSELAMKRLKAEWEAIERKR